MRNGSGRSYWRTKPRRGAYLSLSAALGVVTAQTGTATAQQRFKLSGSASLTESYDDNVFAVPEDRRSDMVSSLTPSLGVSYLSPRLALRARYARGAEKFSRNSELTTLRARQDAILDVDWSPGARWEATGSASYADTYSPGEFTVLAGLDLVGLELRRTPARRVATTASISRRLGMRTRAVIEHDFTRDEIVGGLSIATQVAGLRLERQVGPVDTLRLAYGARQFTAAGDGSTSQALTLNWVREVTPEAHLELKAGPRLSNGTVGPELAATLRYRLRGGEAALSYVQTESAVIGRPTPVTAEGLSATLSRSLGRTFTLTAGPSVFQARGKGLEVTVYGTNLDLAWHVRRHLSLGASHQLNLQYGQLDGRQRGEIVHNTVLLRLVAGAVN
jgi:hypothetical protein